MAEQRLKTLGMLGPLSPTSADHHTHHQWYLEKTAKHVLILCGQIDELVEGQETKVGPDMGVDWINSV